MHHALSSSEVITWTSHFQPGASFRKAPVWTIRRFAIVRTRWTCAGLRSSRPFCCAAAMVLAYCCAAVLSISAAETSIGCYRSTPTAPAWVVLTEAQPASAAAATAPANASTRIRDFSLASRGYDGFAASAVDR